MMTLRADLSCHGYIRTFGQALRDVKVFIKLHGRYMSCKNEHLPVSNYSWGCGELYADLTKGKKYFVIGE